MKKFIAAIALVTILSATAIAQCASGCFSGPSRSSSWVATPQSFSRAYNGPIYNSSLTRPRIGYFLDPYASYQYSNSFSAFRSSFSYGCTGKQSTVYILPYSTNGETVYIIR